MADVQLSITVANCVTVPAMPRKTVEATYSRKVAETNSTTGEATTAIVQDAVQAAVGDDATTSLTLPSVAPNSSIHALPIRHRCDATGAHDCRAGGNRRRFAGTD